MFCAKNQTPDRAKFRYRDRIGKGRFGSGHMGTCVQPGEGCGELSFTIKLRYRQLIS